MLLAVLKDPHPTLSSLEIVGGPEGCSWGTGCASSTPRASPWTRTSSSLRQPPPTDRGTVKRLSIVSLLLVLSACGGGSSAAPKAHASPKSPAFVSAVTPAQVADELGCGDTYQDDTTDEFFVQAVGTCDYETYGTTRILTFADDRARDSFVTTAEGFGGQYIKEHDYAIEYPRRTRVGARPARGSTINAGGARGQGQG
jgi:hypothetical protein